MEDNTADKKESVSVTFPEDEFRKLESEAERLGITVEEFILESLREKTGIREEIEERSR